MFKEGDSEAVVRKHNQDVNAPLFLVKLITSFQFYVVVFFNN